MTGHTVVHHDVDDTGFTVSLSDGGYYEKPGAYQKILDYTTASLPQMAALADASAECSQLLSFDCFRA